MQTDYGIGNKMQENKYENRPTFKTKEGAVRHGMIQYGKDSKGKRNFITWETKYGYSVKRKKFARQR